MAKGEITHVEIPADDLERAKRFYEAVAGWQVTATEGFEDYWMFRTAPQSGGAIGRRGTTVGTTIRPYITVDRLEDAIATAQQVGGRVVTPPQEIPGMGRWAAITDTEGNEVGLWENPPQT
jgi:predicted enzyme related to lactoylglutathione lyase